MYEASSSSCEAVIESHSFGLKRCTGIADIFETQYSVFDCFSFVTYDALILALFVRLRDSFGP